MPFFSGQQTDEEVESQLLWADPPLCRTTRKNHFHHQHHVSHDLILLQKKTYTVITVAAIGIISCVIYAKQDISGQNFIHILEIYLMWGINMTNQSS